MDVSFFFAFELTVVSVCFLELIREDREVSVGGSEEPPLYSCGSEDYGASSTGNIAQVAFEQKSWILLMIW